jgi:hypothetical protein
MKKMFVGVLLASAALVACGSKKASTTPSTQAPQEQELDKTGGSTGGATYGGKAAEPTSKGTPNPCAPK